MAFSKRAGWRRVALSWILVSWILCGSPGTAGAESVHRVYPGQRLGSIAKRYNVTVEAICARNGIKKTDPIQPGQDLIIPDRSGKIAPSSPSSAASRPRQDAPPPPASSPSPKEPREHLVDKGHTLTAIANRYGVTVAAICHAGGLDERQQLDVGQIVLVPDKTDPDGSYARKLRLSGALDRKKEAAQVKDGRPSYARYLKPAWRRGYVSMYRYGRKWRGYVIGPKNEILGQASQQINWVLGAEGEGPKIHPRLIRLLAQVSDAFGGREVRIVSGYRTRSWVNASKHKEGRALDFSIPGVPNEALRDYLRTLPDVGVGYYPNSSFVHLDVREGNIYWVDYAGPGEPPRKHP